jgi:DNA polymerase-3 subunit alpha
MNLMKLVSKAYLDDANGDGLPQVTLDDLFDRHEGPICSPAAPTGPWAAAAAGQPPSAEEFLRRMAGFPPAPLCGVAADTPWTAACPRPSGSPSGPHRARLCAADLPLVATNDVYFPTERSSSA